MVAHLSWDKVKGQLCSGADPLPAQPAPPLPQTLLLPEQASFTSSSSLCLEHTCLTRLTPRPPSGFRICASPQILDNGLGVGLLTGTGRAVTDCSLSPISI